jgi:hypothetical protein
MSHWKMTSTEQQVSAGLAFILLGIAIILCPLITFADLKLIFAACVGGHAISRARRLMHAMHRYSALVLSFEVAIDIVSAILIWFYPADDLWTLALWIPAWAVLAGLIEIAGVDRVPIGSSSRRGGFEGTIALLFGASLAIWPFLVFTLAGAASILLGGVWVVCNGANRADRQTDREWDEHHRANDRSPALLTTAFPTSK